MGLTLYQLNNKEDAGKWKSRNFPLIPKWMGLLRTEDTSWAYPSAIPYGHVIVEADCPRDKEDGSRVVIPCLYYLENFPKLIKIGWRVSVSETKFTGYGIKEVFINESPKAIGAWISLLIKGGDTPKILPVPSRAGGHLKP